MAAVVPQPIATRPYPTRRSVKGSALLRLFHTTDHKQIGIMYLVTSFVFFMVGGAMALLMRTELAQPGLQFLSQEQYSYRYGEVVEVDDPWGYGNSLEWATSCPPPRHNFTSLPRIRSERPAFELHYPHMVERLRLEAEVGHHNLEGSHEAIPAGKDNQPYGTGGALDLGGRGPTRARTSQAPRTWWRPRQER